MSLARFKSEGKKRLRVLLENKIKEISGSLFDLGEETGMVYGIDDVEFLPSICPGKIVCIGFNYLAHMDEMKAIVTKKLIKNCVKTP